MSDIGYGPLYRIDGPPPSAPLYGLLPAAEAPAAGVRIVVDTDQGAEDLNDLSSTGESMDEAIARLKAEGILPPEAGRERWLNGVEVYPYPPDPGEMWDTCSTSTTGQKDFGDDLLHPQFSAFTAYLAETCTSYKVWDQDAFIARAVAAFTAIESSIIERQFMSGEGVPLNPHLSDAASTCVFPNGDTPTSPLNGLSLLEGEIGLTGRQGLLHGSPQFADSLRERFALDNRTGVIRTINGTVLIPGFGYADTTKSTPHGHAAATGSKEWIYATGPVDIRRSEIFVTPDDVSEALDRGTPNSASTGRPNSITYRAERYYLVIWDTELQAAVLVDRCQTTC